MICDYEINFLHVYRYKTVCKITSNILLLLHDKMERQMRWFSLRAQLGEANNDDDNNEKKNEDEKCALNARFDGLSNYKRLFFFSLMYSKKPENVFHEWERATTAVAAAATGHTYNISNSSSLK